MMKRIFLFLTLFIASFGVANASEEKEKFDAGHLIMEHLGDSYYWHVFTYGDLDVSIPLPIILINEGKVDVFMSSKFHHGHSPYKGYKIATAQDGEGLEGSIICVDENGVYTGKKPLDLSITKNVFAIFIVSGLIIFLVLKGAKSAKKREGQAPKGLLTVVEYFISFIKNDIAVPSIGEHRYRKYLPYLLTAFLFIFFSNLLGLFPFFPGGANITGNIAVTLCLALFTFVITNVSGNKHYWVHIINMPGVPWWLKFPLPIMPIVEILGIFTKPFSLTIRLFANITAGHVMILSFICIIFIFGEQSAALGYGTSILPVFFALFMTALEVLVAFIQAYVFTLLSAIYIGMATEEEHAKE
jgi:F-type H+-transporting ATPase subunit a